MFLREKVCRPLAARPSSLTPPYLDVGGLDVRRIVRRGAAARQGCALQVGDDLRPIQEPEQDVLEGGGVASGEGEAVAVLFDDLRQAPQPAHEGRDPCRKCST